MESVGQPLKAAREKKQMTLLDISSATKTRTHIIEAIEHDDFSFMPAPIYAKGFIKLYAECVGIDPAPLIKAYTTYHMPGAKPPQVSILREGSIKIQLHERLKKLTRIKAKIRLYAARKRFQVGEAKHWIRIHWSTLIWLIPRIFRTMFRLKIQKIKAMVYSNIQRSRLKIPNLLLSHSQLSAETWKIIVSVAGVCLLIVAAVIGIFWYSCRSETPPSKFRRIQEPPEPYLDPQRSIPFRAGTPFSK